MQDKMYEMIVAAGQKKELERVLACNEKTEKFGLSLTQPEADKKLFALHLLNQGA